MSSPALNEKTWGKLRDYATQDVMTIEGTINKSGLLILLTIAGAYFGWNMNTPGLMLGAVLVSFALSLVMIFKPPTATYLSQIYAVIEGEVIF